MLDLHSLLRYVVLILLITAVIKSLIGFTGKKPFTEGDKKIGLFLMIGAHLQLVLGLILYMTQGWFSVGFGDAMSNATMRFWKVEHIFAMLVAITLITVGRAITKRAKDDHSKFKKSFIYYTIALILVLWAIPWADRGFI